MRDSTSRREPITFVLGDSEAIDLALSLRLVVRPNIASALGLSETGLHV